MQIIENEQMFDQAISKGVTLVDFYADWCGPCRMIAPYIKELADEFKGKANVVKVNVDNQQKLAMRYGIRSIPTLLIFKNGKIVAQKIGFQTKNSLVDALNEFIK